MLVFIKVHLDVLLDVIEVVQEIMFSVIFKIVCWSIDLPVVPQTFSSLVEFDELLKLEVRATESIFEPVDALSLDNEAQNHSTELHSEESCVSVSYVHVDSSNESPEACVL